MSRKDHPKIGDRRLHTWKKMPERRAGNNGLGTCNTGSDKRLVCCLGGHGCDVDHALIVWMRNE